MYKVSLLIDGDIVSVMVVERSPVEAALKFKGLFCVASVEWHKHSSSSERTWKVSYITKNDKGELLEDDIIIVGTNDIVQALIDAEIFVGEVAKHNNMIDWKIYDIGIMENNVF